MPRKTAIAWSCHSNNRVMDAAGVSRCGAAVFTADAVHLVGGRLISCVPSGISLRLLLRRVPGIFAFGIPTITSDCARAITLTRPAQRLVPTCVEGAAPVFRNGRLHRCIHHLAYPVFLQSRLPVIEGGVSSAAISTLGSLRICTRRYPLGGIAASSHTSRSHLLSRKNLIRRSVTVAGSG